MQELLNQQKIKFDLEINIDINIIFKGLLNYIKLLLKQGL